MRMTSMLFIVALAVVLGIPTTLLAQTPATIAHAKRDTNGDYWPDDTLTYYEITGRVTSPDYARSVGSSTFVEVYLQDTSDNAGISLLFNPTPDPDFPEYDWAQDVSYLALGREVQVQGFIGQTNGLRYVYPSPYLLNSAILVTDTTPVHPAPVPETITNLLQNAEAYEGTLVVVSNVNYYYDEENDPWPDYGQNGFLTMTDSTAEVDLFIDRDTEIPGQLAPRDTFHVIGIWSQFDTSTNNLPDGPNAGYQLLPRYYTDIIQQGVPADSPPSLILSPSGIVTGGENTEITIDMIGQDRNASDVLTFGTTSAFGSIVNLGDRLAAFVWTPPPGAPPTNTVTLTLTDGLTSVTDTVTIVVQPIPTDFWDFEGWDQGWEMFDNGGVENWERSDVPRNSIRGAEETTNYMVGNGYAPGTIQACDDWLVSPQLDLSTFASAQISYYRYFWYSGPILEMKASTAYPGTGDPWNYAWDDLGLAEPSTSGAWEQEAKSLAAYAGNSSVYVAFRYVSNGPEPGQGKEWRVDQIRLAPSAPPRIDAPTEDQVVFVGNTLPLEVLTTEVDGDPVTIETNVAPANSTFADNGDGTADFVFTPDVSQVGTQVLSFIASDIDGAVTNAINLYVYEPIEDNDFWDFEEVVIPWIEYSRASNRDWIRNDQYPMLPGSSWNMYMSGYNADTSSDDWLISPMFDLTGTISPEVTYWSRIFYSGPDLALKVSTDYLGYGDPLVNGTWTDLVPTLPSGSGTWTAGTNSLSAYAGNPRVYLAFQYTSTGTGGGLAADWQVDEIGVRGLTADAPPVISPELANRGVIENTTLDFGITTIEVDGDPITIVDEPSLPNSTLVDNANGTASYSFSPTAAQIGAYLVSFIASDKDGADTNTITISVYATPTGNDADIVITEYMKDPSAVFDDVGEYVEIYNQGTVGVDIGGWLLRDDGTDDHVISPLGPLVVAGDAFLVLGRNADGEINGGVPVDYQYDGFVLGNGADEIILETVAGAVTTEIDRVEYDGGAEWPDRFGESAELNDLSLDNNVGANWSEALTPWPGGDGDLGSPGALNDRFDRDGDGMSDTYEIEHFGGPTNGVATGFSDADPVNNIGEYIADTDPNDPTSYLRITDIEGGTNVVVTFPSSSTRDYQPQFTEDIADPNSWTNLGTAFRGAGVPDDGFEDADLVTDREYRIEASVP